MDKFIVVILQLAFIYFAAFYLSMKSRFFVILGDVIALNHGYAEAEEDVILEAGHKYSFIASFLFLFLVNLVINVIVSFII